MFGDSDGAPQIHEQDVARGEQPSEPPSKRARADKTEGPEKADKSAKKQLTLFAMMKPASPAGKSAVQQPPENALSELCLQKMAAQLPGKWFAALESDLRRPSIANLLQEVEMARVKYPNSVFPPDNDVFAAFAATPLEKVRIVIVGQDPYHGRGQAMGLSFSVPRGNRVPPSLQNMLKEAGVWPSAHGDLTSWTEQGIFLLNTLLTVIEGRPLSHKSLGWERFTDAAIRTVSRECNDVIFLLWGAEAQAKAKLVDESKHKILKAGHPSPLSFEKHFKGCRHFQKVNDLLAARGQPEITWRLPA